MVDLITMLGHLLKSGVTNAYKTARRTFFNLQSLSLLAAIIAASKTRTNDSIVKGQNKVIGWINDNKKAFGIERFKDIMVNTVNSVRTGLGYTDSDSKDSIDSSIEELLNPEKYEMDRGDVEIWEMSLGLASITYYNRKAESWAVAAGVEAASAAEGPEGLLLSVPLSQMAAYDVMKGAFKESLKTFAATFLLLKVLRHNIEKNGEVFSVAMAAHGIISATRIPGLASIFDHLSPEDNIPEYSNTQEYKELFTNYEDVLSGDKMGLAMDLTKEEIEKVDKIRFSPTDIKEVTDDKETIDKYNEIVDTVSETNLDPQPLEFTPGVTVGFIPGETPGFTPGNTSGFTPGNTPGVTPGFTPGLTVNTPGTTQGITPGNIPGFTPGFTPGKVNYLPGFVPGVTPGFTPGVTQGFTPGYTPGFTPGYTPGVTANFTPGVTVGFTPGVVPGFTPGETSAPDQPATPDEYHDVTDESLKTLANSEPSEKKSKSNWLDRIIKYTIFGDPTKIDPLF